MEGKSGRHGKVAPSLFRPRNLKLFKPVALRALNVRQPNLLRVTATTPHGRADLVMATEEAHAGVEDDLGGDVDAPDDLASLSSLDNASVMRGVQRRFEDDKIYTRINTLLTVLTRTPRGSPHYTRGFGEPASCVPYVPEAQGSLPRRDTYQPQACRSYCIPTVAPSGCSSPSTPTRCCPSTARRAWPHTRQRRSAPWLRTSTAPRPHARTITKPPFA